LKKRKGNNPKANNTDTLLKLYQIYDNHRYARLWFLEGLDASDYNEYREKYSGASAERSHFIRVCGFFELSGVLVNHGLVDPNLYFDIFNPTPFWNKARPIIEGMRSKRSDSYYYENFESLNSKRLIWKKKRSKRNANSVSLTAQKAKAE
jgi:Domain of unknown function (DUF4760)